MSVSMRVAGINPVLMGKAECAVCIETVNEKIKQGILRFFGHLVQGESTKSIIVHIICETCNPKVIEQAVAIESFRKCFQCNEIPDGAWRKKFTLDKDSMEFKVEPAPLPIKVDGESGFLEGMGGGSMTALRSVMVAVTLELMEMSFNLALGKVSSEKVEGPVGEGGSIGAREVIVIFGAIAGAVAVVASENIDVMIVNKVKRVVAVILGTMSVAIAIELLKSRTGIRIVEVIEVAASSGASTVVIGALLISAGAVLSAVKRRMREGLEGLF